MGKKERGMTRRGQVVLRWFSVLVILTIFFTVLLMRVFVVGRVEVEGNRLYSQSVIEDAVLNDDYSWNSLYVFLKYRFRDTEKIPFVDTMEITLMSPQELKIQVYEKGMMGYIFIPAIGENAYFDKDGLVVETSSDVIEDIPRIEGIECDQVVLYEKLPIEDRLLKELLTLTQALKRSEMVPDSITYDEEGDPVANYGKIRVQIGSMSDLTQKVERLVKILPALEGRTGTLHLESWTEDTTNIVFEGEKKKKKKNK